MSGGRIKLEMHYAGEICPSFEIAEAVRDGVLDMGYTWPRYSASKIPVGEVLNGTVFSWANSMQASIILHQPRMLEIAQEAFAELGCYYIGPVLVTPAKIISTKPISSIADLKKLIIRTGGASGEIITRLGGAVVSAPGEEIFSSLQKGIFDGSIYGAWDNGVTYGFFDVAKYLLDNVPFANPCVACYVMNLELWNSLPEDLQEIIRTSVSESSRYIVDLVNTREYTARSKATTEMGVQPCYMNDADLAILYAEAMKLWEEIGTRSPRAAEAVEIQKEWNMIFGNIK